MINGLSSTTILDMINYRIHILRTRGEMMNIGIIHKLERQKRKLQAVALKENKE